MVKKKILVFGSTGSVGKNALKIFGANKDKFQVVGLCSNSNLTQLKAQIRQFKPKYVCLRDQELAQRLEKEIKTKCRVFKGQKGLEDFSRVSSDISVMAISGIDCLKPLLINIKYTKRVALANKEAVVVAAKFIFKKAKRHNTEIIPVDSEINAIFQLCNLAKVNNKDIEKVYLTASGGSLFDYSRSRLKGVTAGQVLKHPTWDMGKRITIDSATLVNKGFEVVEAHEFFNIGYEKIAILLHRQSLMHAMVKMKDQTYFSCVYPPDMQRPLSFSFFYPEREAVASLGAKDGGYNFSYSLLPFKKFPLLEVIIGAAKRKDNSLVILNAADEVAVEYFLGKKIGFLQIEKTLKKVFEIYPSSLIKSIKDVYYWDSWARAKTKEILRQ